MTISTIVFIGRDKIGIAQGTKILNIQVSPGMVKDLEIIDKNLLVSSFSTFAEKNGIEFGSVAIILSEDVCFISEGIALSDFLASLPFNNPTGVVWEKKVVGTNKDLIDVFVESAEKLGGEVKTVAPVFLIKEVAGARELDENTAKYIFDGGDILARGFFGFTPAVRAPKPLIETKTKTTPLTFKLVGVFVFLLIVLVVVIFVSGRAGR